MLNSFQHLTKSITYETLNQVQGDKMRVFRQAPIPVLLEKPKKWVRHPLIPNSNDLHYNGQTPGPESGTSTPTRMIDNPAYSGMSYNDKRDAYPTCVLLPMPARFGPTATDVQTSSEGTGSIPRQGESQPFWGRGHGSSDKSPLS